MARRRRIDSTVVIEPGKPVITIAELNGIMSDALVIYATEELNAQVDLGNNVYTVIVDGVFRGNNRDAVNQAQRKVAFDFIFGAIDVAIQVLKQEYQKAILRFVTDEPKAMFDGRPLGASTASELVANVRIFYLAKGKPAVDVTSSSDIKSFSPGDQIIMTANIPESWLSNSYKLRFRKPAGSSSGAVGFHGRTARAIRRKLRLSRAIVPGMSKRQQTSPLLVRAGFSRVAARLLGLTEKTAGRAAILYGHPVIFLRYNPRFANAS